MSIIRQGSLFSIQDLYDLEPTQRFEAIFSTIDIEPLLFSLSKKTNHGAPTELNYAAMIYALVARIVERIPTVKDLRKRLKDDVLFRLECGFLFSDALPSEASFSRLVQKLSQTALLEDMQNQILLQAIQEGFVEDEAVAIDATHFESRDQAKTQEKKAKPEPKKRGRRSKAEKEAYEKQKQEEKAESSVFEKLIADQLDVPLETLRSQMLIEPAWGVKKNSEGKNVFWYGFKGHLAVGTKSQYILQSIMSSGSLNDGKAAIPLLKGLQKLPLSVRYGIMDAGYDSVPIYQQIYRMEAYSIIAYNKRNEGETIGFDSHFAPTCVREYSYRYDSYDPKYKTLKFVRPKECKDCPLAQDSLCQKIYKIRIETDVRRYTAPARGTKKWEELYDQRTAVERVIAYLKEFFQLNNVRYRTGKKAKFHFDLVTLVYNASKLAADRIGKELKNTQTQAA
ncbi:IS1182 family transposase [Aneurinibacillus migulanus]|uniref:Transposase n=1 Tax=Aneurinibacillus migulanus TaxID=47500 RepID=A0A0D1V147_ANEMI|nr:IS1182 family transposase [Aneurinibacillus migulanus]KIV53034.1 transposase [Aneurinibacillus migulanus]KON90934.1 transposase [Aneurinibacillus migulanus]KON93116.1 transposase [Aneurinibacillus migulanus]MED0894132.1 IS1182 family transposase [Aneurinibacillus migulanus]MED1616863.1 IS1182 family transposase [Aneurinibacillus migulanus]